MPEQVRIHASSLNAGADAPEGADGECTAVIFEEVTRNEAFMYIASSTLVRPHFLPLVAAHVRHHEEPVSNGRQSHLRHSTSALSALFLHT